LQGEDEAENLLGGQRPGPNLAGLDEEDLRDMVREMIRQELQGVLGERITRNVRKLVRREIQRALDAEQF
jgi:cell pole-organizing protein PopZ